MDIIFLEPITPENLADWREHQVDGVVTEQPEACSATELSLSIKNPGMFELKVSAVPEALEEFIFGYGRGPDIIDGIAMTPLAESANHLKETVQ